MRDRGTVAEQFEAMAEECGLTMAEANDMTVLDFAVRLDDAREEAADRDSDPTPWCAGCGAKRERNCHCGPIAENN